MAESTTRTLTIDHVGHRGDGVAQDGTFVPYALPGEIVEVTDGPTPDRARLNRVVSASPERIAPFCGYFGTCGGCAMQHWRNEEYRAWKRGLVVAALAQASIACEVDELIDAHGMGRRRLTAHARTGEDGNLRTGFAAAGSHAIVDIDACPILVPQLEGAFDAARAIAAALEDSGKPLDIQITAAQDGLDVDVRGSGPVSTRTIAELSAVSREHRLARLTRHGENIVTATPPVVAIGQTQVTLPPGAFLQATQAGEDALGDLVIAHAKGRKYIADLFSGVGPFALRLAAKARVDAYDSDAPAIAALAKAAAQTPRLKPLRAEVRDLFRRPLVPQELRDIDAVVFDPPRQGAQAQAERLAASKVPLVIAVSCNAVTFARDAAILIKGGYRLTRVTPVDQFRHSAHVELVGKFVR